MQKVPFKEYVIVIYFFRMSLKEIKKKIYHNLKTLEQQGLVSSKNRYQDIVNAIAKVFSILCS